MLKKNRAGVVSVVLVNFRGADDTLECIRGLKALNWPQELLEIIVVENGSGDDSLERLKAAPDDVIVIESKENLGFTGGCNLGVASASGEFIAFLNNDAKPHPDWIKTAIDTFATGRNIGAVASKVLDWEGDRVDFVDAAITWYGMGYKPHAGEADLHAWDEEKDVLFGTGAAMFVRAHVFEEGFQGGGAHGVGQRETGSTGLGLAIVGTVVAAHGGRVDVAPTDAGCLFEVRLPAPGESIAAVLQD